jgi:hypothetical protein
MKIATGGLSGYAHVLRAALPAENSEERRGQRPAAAGGHGVPEAVHRHLPALELDAGRSDMHVPMMWDTACHPQSPRRCWTSWRGAQCAPQRRSCEIRM